MYTIQWWVIYNTGCGGGYIENHLVWGGVSDTTTLSEGGGGYLIIPPCRGGGGYLIIPPCLCVCVSDNTNLSGCGYLRNISSEGKFLYQSSVLFSPWFHTVRNIVPRRILP